MPRPKFVLTEERRDYSTRTLFEADSLEELHEFIEEKAGDGRMLADGGED
jgi:hypothetical protein